jgi:hypothetical protein
MADKRQILNQLAKVQIINEKSHCLISKFLSAANVLLICNLICTSSVSPIRVKSSTGATKLSLPWLFSAIRIIPCDRMPFISRGSKVYQDAYFLADDGFGS